MANLNNNARRDALKRAMRLAEIREEDVVDMQVCIDDLKTAGLDDTEARVVASAYRNKTLPSALLQEGFDKNTVVAFLGHEEHNPMTADFANDMNANPNEDTIPHKPIPHGMDMGHSAPSPDMGMGGPSDDMGDDGGDELGGGDAPSMGGEMGMPESHGLEQPTSMMKDDKPTDDMGTDDTGEAKDNIATLQIEVPADKVDAFQKALDAALSEIMGDGYSTEDGDADNDNQDTFGADDESDASADFPADDGKDEHADFGASSDDDDDSAGGDDDTQESSFSGGDSSKFNQAHTANRKVQTMTKDARAQREAILAKVAGTRTASESEDSKPRDIGLGKDTSHNGKPFQTAADAQYKNEGEFGTMTLEGSEGNSLRDQNPKFATQDIPTLNGDHLGLKAELKPVTKEGGSGESDFYKVDFDMLDNVVTEGIDSEFGNFDVPTQNGTKTRKNTIALASNINSSDDAEEALYQALVTAGVNPDDIANMSFAEGISLYRTITSSNVETLARFAEDTEITINADDEKTPEEKKEEGRLKIQPNGDGFDRTPHKSDEHDRSAATLIEKLEREAQLYRARLKTAYGVNTKLCLAGILEADELESNVDMWLSDGLSVKAMLAAGAQMLRMSQTHEQRVASEQIGRMNRSASNQGVATIPGFSGAPNNVNNDLQQALKSIFTMPRYDE